MDYELVGLTDKSQIIATYTASMSGEILPVQILCQGKTDRCHLNHVFPPEFDIWHTPNHWATAEAVIRYINKVIFPYVKTTHARLELHVGPES